MTSYKALQSFLLIGLMIMLIGISMVSALKYTPTIPSDISASPIRFTFDGKYIEMDYQQGNIQWADGTLIDSVRSSAKSSVGSTDSFSVFSKANIEFEKLDNQLKERIIFSAKPYTLKTGTNVMIESELIIGAGLDVYIDGNKSNKMTGKEFNTTGAIYFNDKTMTRIAIPPAFAVDKSGKVTNLKYFMKIDEGRYKLLIQIPASLFETASYPLTIDPSAVSGCSEDATTITCASGTFTGNYIDTTKNILISSATINGGASDGAGASGLVRLNSTLGWISVVSSTLTGNGGAGGSNQDGGEGKIEILNAPLGVNFTSVTFNSIGGSATTDGQFRKSGDSIVDFRKIKGKIEYYGNNIFNNYGRSGTACGVASGTGNNNGASTYFYHNSTYMKSYGNITIISYAGNGVSGTAGAGCMCGSSGGSTETYFYDGNITFTNKGNMTINADGGNGGNHCTTVGGTPCSNTALNGGGSTTLNIYSRNILNSTLGFWYFTRGLAGAGSSGAPSDCGGGGATGSSGTPNLFINVSTWRFQRQPLLQSVWNSISGYGTIFVEKELTVYNTTFNWYPQSINFTGNVYGKFGVFNSTWNNNDIWFGDGSKTLIVGNTTTITETFHTLVRYVDEEHYYSSVSLNSPANSVTLLSANPVVFNASFISDVNLKNATLFIDGAFSESKTLTGFTNQTTFTKTVGLGAHTWYIQECDTTNACESSDTRSFTSSSLIETGESYNPTTMEGSTETFQLNVSYDPSFTSLNGYLWYNGTRYLGTKTTSGTSASFTRTVAVPTVTANSNMSFLWEIIATGGAGLNYNSTRHNQTVNNFAVDDCSAYSTLLFNFTSYDEDSLSFINATGNNNTIEVDFTIKNTLTNENLVVFSKTYNATNPARVCISSGIGNSTYRLDMTASYIANNYVQEFYYVNNGTLSSSFNSTINFYDLLSSRSTSFLFRFTDSSGGVLAVNSGLVHVFRQYIGDGVFREVERGKLDDNGETHLHLVEEDVVYYFQITQYGRVVYTSSTYNAKCLATPCTIDLKALQSTTPFPTDWDRWLGTAYELTSNKTARTVSLSFQTNSSTPSVNASLVVFNYVNGQAVIINQTSLVSSSGTISVYVPTNIKNTTIYANVRFDGAFVRAYKIDWSLSARDIFGTFGAILGGFMMIVLVLLAVSEGVGLIIFIALGLIIMTILTLIDMSWLALISIICAGGIIVWKITKRGRA